MPEGTQLIALTKTFASQILKDYPDSLGDTGFDSIEAYMDQLAKCRHLQQMEEMFYQLCHGMEQYLEKQKDCSRIVSDIRTFCLRHLDNVGLGGQMVMDHFHLSSTYLNQLF